MLDAYYDTGAGGPSNVLDNKSMNNMLHVHTCMLSKPPCQLGCFCNLCICPNLDVRQEHSTIQYFHRLFPQTTYHPRVSDSPILPHIVVYLRLQLPTKQLRQIHYPQSKSQSLSPHNDYSNAREPNTTFPVRVLKCGQELNDEVQLLTVAFP